MPDSPMDLDPAVQSSLRELMHDDYPLLLDTFIQDSEKRLATLTLSLAQQDWEMFRQTAHSFKGSCGNMGAQALQQACERAEQAGLSANAAAASQSCQDLQRLFERVQLHLHR